MGRILDSIPDVHPVPKPTPERLRVLSMSNGDWTVEIERGSRFGARVELLAFGRYGCSCRVRTVPTDCAHIAAVRDFEAVRNDWGPSNAPMAERSGRGLGFSEPRFSEMDEVDGRVDPSELYGLPRRRNGDAS